MKHYVYEHWLDGVCFYVGKGSGRRYKDFNMRDESWKKFVNKRNREIETKIIKYFDNRMDAFKFEAELTKKRKSEGHPILGLKDSCEQLSGELNPMFGKRGKLSPFYRKTVSEETRQKISKNRTRLYGKDNPSSRAVVQLDKDGNYIDTFEAMTYAERKTGAAVSNILKCCKGQRKSAGGFKWMFLEEFENQKIER